MHIARGPTPENHSVVPEIEDMRWVLIVYPHWPPSNLAGVHRVRLIANALPKLGWKPIVLTVDERDHEEALDPLLEVLVNPEIEVIKVRAKAPLTLFGRRIAGDIGLRAWTSLKKKSEEILQERKVDFIWYSLPSWYPCLAGSALSKKFSVPFAIDYQDPWIYEPAAGLPWFHRERWVARMARILEPRALRGCAFISAINEAYMAGPLERHTELKGKPNVGIQLGFDPNDHQHIIPEITPPWEKGIRALLYAGTYWPQGEPLFDLMLDAVAAIRSAGNWPEDLKLVFIGTGNDGLKPLSLKAVERGISDVVLEFPERIPYMHVLQFMRDAHATLAFGSVAAHYSPSKVFQLLLSGKPIIACFHPDSSIFTILAECHADKGLVPYDPSDTQASLDGLKQALNWVSASAPDWNPNLDQLEPHSASSNAKRLVESMETVLQS